jgi:hypothetical protein
MIQSFERISSSNPHAGKVVLVVIAVLSRAARVFPPCLQFNAIDPSGEMAATTILLWSTLQHSPVLHVSNDNLTSEPLTDRNRAAFRSQGAVIYAKMSRNPDLHRSR